MRRHREDNRLSSGDALFLYLEREGMPLNVASVSVFEGEISLRACTRFIESKLPLIPRYRQRVVAPPFNIGLPTWEYDPHFDVRNHIHHITLKHGADAEFKAVAGKILSKVMDRQRPLWDFTLVHGLKGNRTGVVTRMHHCLADGLAGVSLMNVLMDPSPEVRPLPKRKPRFQSPPQPPAPAFLDELINSSVLVAEKVLSAQMELFQVLQQIMAVGEHRSEHTRAAQPAAANSAAHIPSVDQFARFMPELTAATQPLPFNVICRGPQKFGWAEIPLADIKAVKNAFAVTVNDVALALVASAFQHYAELRGVRIKGRLLRIVVPVNVRGNGNAGDLGNRITFVPVTIPLDIRSPRKLVAAIHERTTFLKGVHVAECVSLFGTILGTIPTAAQELAGPIVSQVPLGLCNFIFTNVPGPTTPLYLLGHQMLRCFPYVPIGGDLGINCAVLTYNGIAYFGLTADVHAAPDVGRLEKLLSTSFAKLSRAAGCRPPRKSRPKVKAKTLAVEKVEPQTAAQPQPPLPQPFSRIQPQSVHAPITNTQEENALLATVGV
jgi:diacylglycerol O-acyltransferase / wax synthase